MLEIGTTTGGRKLGLSDSERARHVHVLGSIGTGKSKLLEHMIRQDIARGRGLCLIDPHGTLTDSVDEWCAVRGFGKIRRIHVIRPGDNSLIPGFNPLRAGQGEDLSVRVDAMVAACAQAWGVRDLGETPRLEKILRATFYALAVRNLTLAEGPALLQARDPEGLRRLLTEGLPNPTFQITWDELNGMPRKDFAEHVESTHTRLARFLSAPAMRLVVGQQERSIDFRRAMDNGEIVLVNLGARRAFSYENARVLGTLLINDLFLTALGRDEKVARKRPFTLYVDEAYDFLSGDIERILDQTRKFGLHAVLAHQRIGQLRERGEGIYNAVMGGTQTKIVLGGLSDEDAEIMAHEIMRGDIDLEKPKTGLDTPVVVDEVPFWLESESESDSYASSYGISRSMATTESTGTSDSTAENYSLEDNGSPEQRSMALMAGTFAATARTSGISTTEAHAFGRSHTAGRSQTLKPVRQWRHTAYYSLDECFHLAQVKIRNLPDQTAIVKRRGRRTLRVRTIEVRPAISAPPILKRFRQAISERSPFVTNVTDAQLEVDGRLTKLIGRQYRAEDTFWHEETNDDAREKVPPPVRPRR